MAESLVGWLLRRGDKLEVLEGRLVITPASGMSVPADWTWENERPLTRITLLQLGMDAFIYTGYSTGRYGPKLAAGVQLQFESLVTGESAYCVFNAKLDYCRGSKAGQPLPKGRFRVGERTEFVKFWKRTGLQVPPRSGSYYDYMGNLKRLVFAARYDDGQKLDKKSIQPLVISYKQVRAAFGDDQLPYKLHTIPVQVPDKSRTKAPYNKCPQAHAGQGLRLDQAASEVRCGIRLTGSASTRGNVVPISHAKKRPEDQSTAEWLADYGEVENPNFPNDFG